MKKLKIFFVIVILTLLPLLTFAYSHVNEKNEWTLMFYMATDNKMYGNAKKYLHELTNYSSDKISMIALIDGDKDEDTFLYYIGKGKLVDLQWDEKESNTGNPLTLEKFCNFCKENYPAKHYALIIVSVGPGWQGICPDYRHGYRNFSLIPITSLANVLKNITQNGKTKLDIVSLVACLQGMIEIAYELSPYAKYLIAAESDNVFLDIWPSPETIGLLKMLRNTEEFAIETVKHFEPKKYHPTNTLIAQFFDNLPFKKLNVITENTTLSAINLSKVDGIVTKLDKLSRLLLNDKEAVNGARKNVNEYGKWSPKYHIFYPIYDRLSLEIYAYDCNIDLYDFIRLLKNETTDKEINRLCNDILTNIKDAVIEKSVLPGDRSNGISIYFPSDKFSYNHFILLGNPPYPYENLSFSKDTHWDEFIKNYLVDHYP